MTCKVTHGQALWLGALVIAIASCTAQIVDPSGREGSSKPGVDAKALVPKSGMRRLTVDEYNNTLRDLMGDESASSALLLPTDVINPFDNDSSTQKASPALIEAAEALARDASDRLMNDPARRDNVVGCTPTGPDDSDCFKQFITAFGRKAIRRTLKPEEIDKFMTAQQLAIAEGDFYAGVDVVVRAFLQHPEFLYRVEIGKAVSGRPGVFRLTGNELATRLSYLIWGSTPDAWLLDQAESGKLETAEQVRAAAQKALDDPRAKTRIKRFHALWLGYETLPFDPSLAKAMRAESDALVERVVFEEHRAWTDLFRSDETFVSDTLASHYGIPLPGSSTPVWTSYGTSGRKGILSHGSFLANGAKFGDTSPTLRGLAIRTRLLCQKIPPPPTGVKTDNPVTGDGTSNCKKDRYKQHAQGGCASCHSLMDPVGFGLENYDQLGRYRTHDVDAPECSIDGTGDLAGIGTFQGPAGLEDLLLAGSELNRCVVTQLYRFAMGRKDIDDTDDQLIEALTSKASTEFRFDDVLLDFVSHDAFRVRRDES